MSKSLKNIFSGLIIMTLCFFAYQYWGKAETSDPQLISAEKTGSRVGDETLKLLLELKTLVLDEDIFADKVFKNLEDFSIDLPVQPVGRNNPFALVGTDGEYISVNIDTSNSSENNENVEGDSAECEGDSCPAETPENQ